jgi:hypothetical protein
VKRFSVRWHSDSSSARIQPRGRGLKLARSGVLAVGLASLCALGVTAAANAAATKGSFGAAVGSAAAQAATRLGAGQELTAGQTGARSAVPWSKVGPGWTLAEYTAGTYKKAKPVTLYLLDPQGGKYQLYQWSATKMPWQLISWSGDKSRALFEQFGGKRPAMHQLTLATGKLTTFRLPTKVGFVLGYTHPTGQNILVFQDGVARYNLSGAFQVQLVKGRQFDQAMSSPDGTTELTNGPTGPELLSNAGGVIRRLHVPGIQKTGGCSPVRWWTSTVALVSCLPPNSGSPQLWLVPVSGATPTALTPVRTGGPDLGDIDAWRFSSGLYVQAAGACGTQFIGKQAANGTVSVVTVPHSPGNNVVVATAGDRMLVREFSACGPASSVVWFNPATRSVKRALAAPAGGDGVLYVVAYNKNGEEPTFLT